MSRQTAEKKKIVMQIAETIIGECDAAFWGTTSMDFLLLFLHFSFSILQDTP